jgi:hypothetical protein
LRAVHVSYARFAWSALTAGHGAFTSTSASSPASLGIGSLASGDYWLEAQVNPTGTTSASPPSNVIVESDLTNSTTRVVVHL